MRTPKKAQPDKKYQVYIEYNLQADNACKSTGISVFAKEWNDKGYDGIGEIRATANTDYKYYNNALHKRIECLWTLVQRFTDFYREIK